MASAQDSSASGRLLTTLYTQGSLTRSQATTQSTLARSAAGSAIVDLEDLGLIWTLPAEASEKVRGRPSPMLGIREDGAMAIAVDLRRDSYILSMVDLGRQVRRQQEHIFDAAVASPSDTLRRIASDVGAFAAAHGGNRIAGIGLSIPGIVSGDHGIAKAALSIGWKDVPAGDLLRTHLNSTLPVVVEHDATLGALAEFRVGGGGYDAKRLLYLTAQPQGLGAAMIRSTSDIGNPELYGLQAGHLSIDPNGLPCSCGACGCLELYVDGQSIRSAVGLRQDSTVQEIAQALISVPAGAFEESTVMSSLHLGLVALINILGPDRVVLSGALAPLAKQFAPQLRRVLALSVVAQVQHVLLRPAELGDAVALGAAERAFGPLLRDPSAFASAQGWAR